jgi:hypothetical protein
MSMAPQPTRARMQTLEAVRQGGGGFDADAWHVMDQRDNALIADEILNGSGSSKFVYQFSVAGTAVAGISVIGARHLATYYGGIKHRIVATMQKTGALFTFTSYPQPGMPMSVQCSVVPELQDEEDFVQAVVEMTDVKTGNSIQAEKRESRYERRRDGSSFERPHYASIAQAKAYRNALLSLVPQDVQLKFKLEMLRLGKDDIITDSVLEQKRAGVLRFAASKGMPVDRRAIEALTIAQISGLSDAARAGLTEFQAAARGLAVLDPEADAAPNREPPKRVEAPKAAAEQKPTQSKPKENAPKKWTGYLCNEAGEMLGQYGTPLAYAQALTGRWLTSADPEALLKANAEWISEAAAMHDDLAREIIEGLTNQPALVAVEAPVNSRGINWPAYVKALPESLMRIGVSRLNEWATLNLPTIAKAPDSHRLSIVKLVTEHAAHVGGEVPDVIQQMIERPDLDSQWVDDTMRDVTDAADSGELIRYTQSTAVKTKMARLATERPELYQRLDAAIDARLAELDSSDSSDHDRN